MQVIQIESYTPPPLTNSKAKSLTQSMPLTYYDWQAINNAQLQPIDDSNTHAINYQNTHTQPLQ